MENETKQSTPGGVSGGSGAPSGGAAAATPTDQVKQQVQDTTQKAQQAVGQAAQQAQQQASQVVQQAQDAAGEVVGQLRDQLRTRLVDGKDEAAHGFTTVAESLHETSHRLRQQGQAVIGEYVDTVADTLGHAAHYLNDRTVEQLGHEVGNYARQRPEIFLGAAFAIGLVTARFFKSTSKAQVSENGSSTMDALPAPGSGSTGSSGSKTGYSSPVYTSAVPPSSGSSGSSAGGSAGASGSGGSTGSSGPVNPSVASYIGQHNKAEVGPDNGA